MIVNHMICKNCKYSKYVSQTCDYNCIKNNEECQRLEELDFNCEEREEK